MKIYNYYSIYISRTLLVNHNISPEIKIPISLLSSVSNKYLVPLVLVRYQDYLLPE